MNDLQNIKGLLFDKDGTLIDFHASWSPTTERVIRYFGQEDAELQSELARLIEFDLASGAFLPDADFIHGSNDNFSQGWITALNLPETPESKRRIAEAFARFGATAASPFSDTAPVLQTLKDRGYILGIATNDSERSALLQMEHLGMLHYFDVVLGYDSGYGAKPEPGMVREFARRTGLAIGEIAMIGDSLHDINSGRRAGAVPIGITTGMLPAKRLTHASALVVDSLSGLVDLLTSQGEYTQDTR